MKAKKIILVLAAVLCCALFSSCEKHDQTSGLYSYRAYGQLSTSGGMGSYSVSSFQSAINSVVGDGPSQMNDAQVIVACDAVDAKIKADTGTKYSGYVEITRQAFNDSGKATVLKKYTY